MKIAAVSDDGKMISQHFGRAAHFLVLTIEDKKIVGRELRDKLGHNQFFAQEDRDHSHGKGQHGMDSASHDKHTSMASSITDCQVVLCGGMGMGAYQSLSQLGIQPIVTDIQDIDEAVQAYLDNKLVDKIERLH
jgi:predicted Fe-Mo cluster-binding NifX family protein